MNNKLRFWITSLNICFLSYPTSNAQILHPGPTNPSA